MALLLLVCILLCTNSFCVANSLEYRNNGHNETLTVPDNVDKHAEGNFGRSRFLDSENVSGIHPEKLPMDSSSSSAIHYDDHSLNSFAEEAEISTDTVKDRLLLSSDHKLEEKCSTKKAKCSRDPKFHHCFFCPHQKYINRTCKTYIKTVCSVSSTNVSEILTYVVENTTDLEIYIDNKWDGYYLLASSPIDLMNISRLPHLETFHLHNDYYNFLQPYLLDFGNAFQNLTKLTELHINLPLVNQSLVDMIEPLTSLEVLNISFTRGLAMDTVRDILNVVSNTSLRYLRLQTFQLIGGNGYSGVLNMTEFLSNRVFGNLEELTLGENSLYRIYPGIIRAAPNLKLFDISGNILLDSINLPVLLEAAIHPTITVLNMGYQGYIGGVNQNFRNTNRQEYNTHIIHDDFRIDDETFHGAHQDTGSQNRWTTGNNRKAGLHLDVNTQCFNQNDRHNISNLAEKPVFYRILQCLLPAQFGGISNYSNDMLDALPDVTLMLNASCMLYMNLPLGPQLEKVYFNQIHWEESMALDITLEGNFCLLPNKLNTVFFTHHQGWHASAKLIETVLNGITYIHGADHLQHLDVSNNNMTFNITRLTASDFFPNIKYVNIAGNNMSMPNNFGICDNFPQLETIDLTNNRFDSYGFYFKISKNIAANCPNLKSLFLGHNNMTSGLKLNLSGTFELKKLDLSYNRLHFLDETLQRNLSAIARHSNGQLEIDLTGNELLCGCIKGALQFLKWMVTERNQIRITNADNMMCASEDNYLNIGKMNLEQIESMYAKCFPSAVPLIVGTAIGMVMFIMLAFGFLAMYNNRWKLWYKWFCLKTMIKGAFTSEVQINAKWTYDAFVSYCAEDRFWVHGVLMKTLEEYYGFRLCIHYRDFPVGESIPVTVSRSMANSREIIVIISEVALKSEWCTFELDQAILQAQRRKKPLVVVKMGKFKNPVDSSSAAHVLDRYTYLEWPEKKEGYKLFWAKTIAKMYGDSNGCSCCLPYGSKAIKYNEIEDENVVNERAPLIQV